MIYIDVDGVLVDFIGTAKKKFGIEMEHNVFGKWQWGTVIYPYAKEFYEVAEPQEWVFRLIQSIFFANERFQLITKDFADIKGKWLKDNSPMRDALESPNSKAFFCKRPCDLLIDDNPAECEAWRAKGGIAYWFNLAEDDPFGKFLKWWRIEG